MKKFLAPLFLASTFILCACHHGHCAAKDLNIVAATFPVYQFTANICNKVKNAHVSLLVPATVGCPHDFSLKPADIRKLEKADAIVINGAGLEGFLTKPLASLKKKPKIIDAGQNVPTLDDDSAAHAHINPHIFASPANAALMVANIATKLAEIDPDNIPAYNQNATNYADKLKKLSASLKEVGKKAKNRRISLEHSAIAYLAGNAGLDIMEIFENTESAAQLEKIRQQIKKDKPALLAGDSQYPDKLLRALAAETKIPFARLNPCAAGPDDAPLDYYETVMQANLETLEKFFAPK